MEICGARRVALSDAVIAFSISLSSSQIVIVYYSLKENWKNDKMT